MASKDKDSISEKSGSNGGTLMKQLDNYIIVDIGANLTNKKFSRDLDSVVQRAKDSGKNDTHTGLYGSFVFFGYDFQSRKENKKY